MMKDFKKIVLILVVMMLLLLLVINSTQERLKDSSSKAIVATSSFALYDITKYIAEDSVKIVNILPFGVDAHSFEPTPKLMASLEKSQLVIYSGAGLEPWTEGFSFSGTIIDMSSKVRLRELRESHYHKDHLHTSNSTDPHYWLDFNNMKIAVGVVTTALIELSPQNRELYIKNRESYIKMLENLDSAYTKDLGTCAIDTIITNHNAFSYLANRYSFEVESLSGLSPEAQPSAKQIVELMHHIKEDNITTIFFESFVSDRVMKSIAKDTHVTVDTLQPLGNITKDEAEQNATYESIMRENLSKLSKALMCH